MLHDIYSLGVVLLEIGLWESLMEWNNDEKRYIFAPFLTDLVVGTKEGKMIRAGDFASQVKGRLLEMANLWLPVYMGETYTGVVVACLKVMEGGMVELNDF